MKYSVFTLAAMSRFMCPRKSSLWWTSSGSNWFPQTRPLLRGNAAVRRAWSLMAAHIFILVCHQVVAVVVSFHLQPGHLPVLPLLHDQGGQEHVEEEEQSQIRVQPEWVLWFAYIGQRGIQCTKFVFMYFVYFVSAFPYFFPYVVILQFVMGPPTLPTHQIVSCMLDLSQS